MKGTHPHPQCQRPGKTVCQGGRAGPRLGLFSSGKNSWRQRRLWCLCEPHGKVVLMCVEGQASREREERPTRSPQSDCVKVSQHSLQQDVIKNQPRGAGALTQWLRALWHTAFAEDPSSVLSAYINQLTTACNSESRESNASGLHEHLHSRVHMHTRTCTRKCN